MATSAIPDAIDWLVDTCRADPALGTADPPVLVLDGLEVVDLSSPRILWVGVEDPDDPSTQGVTATQAWAGLGAMRKDETFQLSCCARAWSGDADTSAVRRTAFELFGAVEDIVRGSANLGGTVLLTLPGITNQRVRSASTKSGAITDVMFEIHAKARI